MLFVPGIVMLAASCGIIAKDWLHGPGIRHPANPAESRFPDAHSVLWKASPMFRYVPLPNGVKGRLYLHSMPGRFEPLQASIDEIQRRGIAQVICLVTMDEIKAKSPQYARLLSNGGTPWRQVMFPIIDFGVPDDRRRYLSFVVQIAQSLRAGDYVLVHCAAGIGRTGLLATSLLIALGMSVDAAQEMVHTAGSYPERPEQIDLLQWVAQSTATSGMRGGSP